VFAQIILFIICLIFMRDNGLFNFHFIHFYFLDLKIEIIFNFITLFFFKDLKIIFQSSFVKLILNYFEKLFITLIIVEKDTFRNIILINT
jgi:hypothetical protein